MAETNVVIRKTNPGQGQGQMRAVSQRTGWEYEHDETDAQIDTIEEIIRETRRTGNVHDGASPEVRGAVFSWTSDTDMGEGNVKLATMYKEDDLWVCESWVISPDGTIKEQEAV